MKLTAAAKIMLHIHLDTQHGPTPEVTSRGPSNANISQRVPLKVAHSSRNISDLGISNFDDHPLCAASLKPQTRKSYVKGFKTFRETVRKIPEEPDPIDDILAFYNEEEYDVNPNGGHKTEM